jgi:hypothetical protein
MFIKTDNGCIIDTDFVEEYSRIPNPGNGIGGWYGMFRIYEHRGLNVGANMALAFKHWAKERSYPDDELTIEEIIEDNKVYNPLYEKYAKDIEKYLMLI